MLRYIGAVGELGNQADEVLDFAESPDAIYDYQLYLIAKAFFESDILPLRYVEICRRWLRDRNRARWLRTYAMAALGKAGDTSDLTWIETQYSSAETFVARRQTTDAVNGLSLPLSNVQIGSDDPNRYSPADL